MLYMVSIKRQYVDVNQVEEMFMILGLYKHLCHDNEQIDDITNALCYAILYGQSHQVTLLITHATDIDQTMLTRKIPVRRISLIELAAHNKDGIRCKFKSRGKGIYGR